MNDNELHIISNEMRSIMSRQGWSRTPEAMQFLLHRRELLLNEYMARRSWTLADPFSPESLKKGTRVKGGTAPMEATFRATFFKGMFLFLPQWFVSAEGATVCIASHIELDPVNPDPVTEMLVDQAGRHGLKVCISSFPSWENPGTLTTIEYTATGGK
jgi:hypothetical protein